MGSRGFLQGFHEGVHSTNLAWKPKSWNGATSIPRETLLSVDPTYFDMADTVRVAAASQLSTCHHHVTWRAWACLRALTASRTTRSAGEGQRQRLALCCYMLRQQMTGVTTQASTDLLRDAMRSIFVTNQRAFSSFFSAVVAVVAMVAMALVTMAVAAMAADGGGGGSRVQAGAGQAGAGRHRPCREMRNKARVDEPLFCHARQHCVLTPQPTQSGLQVRVAAGIEHATRRAAPSREPQRAASAAHVACVSLLSQCSCTVHAG